MTGWHVDRTLLERCGASVQVVDGCCGLAGNFGMERGHYEVSVAVAESALLPAVRAAAPGTVLLADGFSCRTQLEQLAGPDPGPGGGGSGGRPDGSLGHLRAGRPLHLAELLTPPTSTV